VFRPVQAARRPVPLHPVTAAVCGLVSIGLLLSLSAAAAGDPELGPLPRPGGAGWWGVAAVLVLQALSVAWVGRFPATVLPGLAALPLVLALAVPGAAFTVTTVAELAGVFLAVVARPRRRLRVALGPPRCCWRPRSSLTRSAAAHRTPPRRSPVRCCRRSSSSGCRCCSGS
jgi:hypothetical protein